jgi:hypothetical protein
VNDDHGMRTPQARRIWLLECAIDDALDVGPKG